MATEVLMPQMGESITEGTITKWLVQVGETVEQDQPLFEISTDKVDAEVPSPAAGTILELKAEEGDTVPVDEIVAIIGEEGEEPSETEEEPSTEEPDAEKEGEERAAEAARPQEAGGEADEETAPAPEPEEEAVDEPLEETDEEPAAAAAESEGEHDYDLVVIGSGPGGYVAGIRAGQAGLKVAVVERDPQFGGTCLHRGCIPTKALLWTAELLDDLTDSPDFGVVASDVSLDVEQAHAHKRKVVQKNAKGIEYLFDKNGVEGIHGTGRLVDRHTVEVESGDGELRTLDTRYVLIATGSTPREIPVAETDGERILNSNHLLEMERVPESIVVLGAGAVGSEFASMFRSFGSEVTLVEMLPRLLPMEDEEVSKELEKVFTKRGITCMTNSTLTAAETTDHGVKLTIEAGDDEESLEAELLLVAIGRRPVTDGVGLEEVGVEVDDDGYVPVDEWMRTDVDNVYAIGDVVPDIPWLAHVASAMGIVAVERMAGHDTYPIDFDKVPSVTFCSPEVASCGLTEAEAKERGYEVETGKFPFSALGKAAIIGKTAGFVKVVRETEYDEVLGVHIIGAHATDLIAEACAALELEATAESLFRTVHAHPTIAESVGEAAHASHGEAIHF